MKIAFKIGLTPGAFYSLTWREFWLMVEVYEQNNWETWHRTRMICWAIFSVNMKKGKQIKPEKVFKLPGDELFLHIRKKEKQLTFDEFLQIAKKAGKSIGKYEQYYKDKHGND